MAKKKPYTITENEDRTLTLQIGAVSARFRNRIALNVFAERLHEMAQYQWVGMFRLKEKDDGSVDLIFNKSGDIIHAKNYDNLCKLAMHIIEDLHEGQ